MNYLFGLLAFLFIFLGGLLFVDGIFSQAAPSQAAAFAGACFFGIMARICQAQSVIEATRAKTKTKQNQNADNDGGSKSPDDMTYSELMRFLDERKKRMDSE